MSKSDLKSFHQLLKAVDFPDANTLDERAVSRLFLNMDDKEKEALFKWIVIHFATSLESYVTSDEKLSYLLMRTGLVDSKVVCASFLCGLLPHDEQLDIWRNILSVIHYHKKGQEASKETRQKDGPKQAEAVASSLRINLIPPEYQKDFEEQTKGNFKEYLETMKEKLLRTTEEEDETADSMNCGSEPRLELEEAVLKILDSKPSPNAIPNGTSIELEEISRFCSHMERLKPQLYQSLEHAEQNQDVVNLPHLTEFLEEYSFMAKTLETFKAFSSAKELFSDSMDLQNVQNSSGKNK